jgi:hypothetical protein
VIGPEGVLTVALPMLLAGFSLLLAATPPTVIDSPAYCAEPSSDHEVS